jgi:hypothetical protein
MLSSEWELAVVHFRMKCSVSSWFSNEGQGVHVFASDPTFGIPHTALAGAQELQAKNKAREKTGTSRLSFLKDMIP